MASLKSEIIRGKITSESVANEFNELVQSQEWKEMGLTQRTDKEYEFKKLYNAIRYFEKFEELYLDEFISDEEIENTEDLFANVVSDVQVKVNASYSATREKNINTTKNFASF